jgi:hypothetical protein
MPQIRVLRRQRGSARQRQLDDPRHADPNIGRRSIG